MYHILQMIRNNLEIKEPEYYYRQFNNDIPPHATNKEDDCHLVQRVALAALPFLTLYAPLGRGVALCSDSCRVIFNLKDLFSGSTDCKNLSINLIKTAASATALFCSLLFLPVGLLITTCQDILINLGEVNTLLNQNQTKAAYEKIAQMTISLLYLGLFFSGSLELLVVSLFLQVLWTGYNSVDEFEKANYLEAFAHLLMTFVRGHQLALKVQALPRTASTVLHTPRISEVTGLPLPEPGKQPVIYHSDANKKLRQAFLKSIADAKKSILIMTFTFSDEEIINLLVKKAHEGIKVTIIIDKDQMGSVLRHAQLLNVLTRRVGEGRIHQKVMVLDEAVVWIGSANFSPDALTLQNNTMIGVYSPEMAKALHEEKEVFMGLRKRASTPFPPIMIGGQKVEMLLFPCVPYTAEDPPEKELNAYGKKRVLELINQAESNLRLAICVWTDPDLAQAVIQAKERGVKVEILLWKAVESATMVNTLRTAGISVIEKPHLLTMHNKWMLIDNTTFFNGSANWSRSWFTRNDETAIILNNLKKEQEQYLIDYWSALLRS